MTIVVQVILNRRNRILKKAKAAQKAKAAPRRLTAAKSMKEMQIKSTEPLPTDSTGKTSTRKSMVKQELDFLDKQFAELQFEKYDTNENKELDYDELVALLTKLNEGIPPTEAEILELVSKADTNGTGTIDTYEELQEAIAQWYVMLEDNRIAAQTNDQSCVCTLQ
ncbi:hypothetical protein CYMTET_6620 [Cymbomonas tetramitiformis]|uniref:EF-hand domain-containing protein n=1 Tax=Cymbomonas tetramitiformis TaxID=36881 RepID=A0AAE0GX65_9CHLO|nr:hypothetical protein CYMTET_6620 [Cymbomonas tetramitiformis]